MLDNLNFKILSPLAVTSAELLSGIPDAENQIYNAGTTYATGDLVWYAGNAFRSKVDSNTGNTPAEGVNWADLGEVDEGALAYNAGTTYALDDYAVYQGQLWQAAVAGESGNTPSATSVKWTRIGATNRFKAFDGFLQDMTSLPGGISYVMQFADLVTDLAILRASGNEARVTMTDAVEGLVYDQTFPLQDDSAIIDAWAYCFAPFIFNDTVLAEELPPFAGAEISITIDGTATTCGQIIFGAGLLMGSVKVGTSVGIESYSIKGRDDFNRSLVVARPYSDTVDFDLSISTTQVGYVKRRLAEREALPTLYYMSGGGPYGAVAYGFFQNFDILHSTAVLADCVLEIEGLG
jgi:hypothetical protein